MQISILGALEVRDDAGRTLDVAGARLQTLLIRLALEPGRAVSTATLVDAVWGAAPPADQTNALQTLVSRLRRACGSPSAVGQLAGGYRLSVTADDVDASRFERLVTEATRVRREGDDHAAVRLFDEALALWRAPMVGDVWGAGSLAAAAEGLDEARRGAQVARAEAVLETGVADIGALDIAALERLAAEQPLQERPAGVLIRVLAAAGRQADALRAYDRLRTQLADELGIDPSRELQQLHLAVLRDEIAVPRGAPRRTNLRARLTSFVGRENELERVRKALGTSRLVTLVGPGGAGKTRLATESVAGIEDAPDGIWLVELATVTSAVDVASAVLGAIGLREIHLMDRNSRPTPRDATVRLVDALADKQALLILDNCEHVVDEAARLAESLLGECLDLRVLATSREPLDIFGETLLPVPMLGQPEPGASVADALAYPAIRLFADRAAAVRADFRVDAESVETVIEIVRRLDGLPLAIELAAARLRTMPIEDIAARLSDRFRLLTGGSRTALPRHRTLRAVVEWSWDLLGEPERRLVEALSVFPSGVTVDSATAMCPSGVGHREVPDLLASLVDKSLLQTVGSGHRMRMLETIREYGTERLAERAELGAARGRHADHFAALLARAAPFLTTSEQLPWFAVIRDELENVLAALRYRADVGDADGALQVAVALGGFAMLLGDHADVAGWMVEALSVPGSTDTELRLTARAMFAINTLGSGNVDRDSSPVEMQEIANELASFAAVPSPMLAMLRPAVAFFAGDGELSRRLVDDTMVSPDPWARAVARMFLANIAENEGDVSTMRVETERALAEFRQIGERWGTASMLGTLAQLRTLDGDLDGAIAAYDEALGLMRELATSDDQMYLLSRLADVALRQGDNAAALEYTEQARKWAESSGSQLDSAFTVAMLGEIERRIGNLDRADELVGEAMRRLRSMPEGHPVHGHIRVVVISAAGRLALTHGDNEQALALAVEGFAAAIGTRDRPLLASVGVLVAALTAGGGDRTHAAGQLGAAAALRGADDLTEPDVRRLTDRLRAALGDEAFERAYAGGRTLARDEAIARLDPS